MKSKWIDDFRSSELIGSHLAFTRFEIIVHRHRDEDPRQWVYSCYRYGRERVCIGDLETTLGVAKQLAVDSLLGELTIACAALAGVSL